MTERLERTLLRRFPDAAVDTPEPTVDTQAEILELALTNLLENALKHADGPDPAVTLRVRTVDAAGPSTVVDVVDANDRIPERRSRSSGAEPRRRSSTPRGSGCGS